MPQFHILYDEPHEADWFRSLHKDLIDATEESITNARDRESLSRVLAYDRPDIILMDGEKPILVVEETVEVPSGHNVGQRFARIAAAAEAGIPCIYFGPYVAKKHGGVTAGPRYMNVRLFHALDAMERVTGSAVTTINWPVDEKCEVRRDSGKDADVREYISDFLTLYRRNSNLAAVNAGLISSPFHARMIAERNNFVESSVRRPDQYDKPPASVQIHSLSQFERRIGQSTGFSRSKTKVVIYNIGMNRIRSDPYTGMAILYKYLYIEENPSHSLVLWFPNIKSIEWTKAAKTGNRKDVRLYRIAAAGILFQDKFVVKRDL